jgi:curved DNA-binding protein CbpA
MIDYFALLQQPRRPWLDPEKLKDKYHRLTISAHPDRQTSKVDSANQSDFANVNEAYRVLSDPKLRLQHLLALENVPSNTATIPTALSDVFLETGTLIQELDRLLARSTTNALSKALIKSEITSKQELATDLLQKLQIMHAEAVNELRAMDKNWDSIDSVAVQLTELSSRFAYLTRWIAQLEERKFQLSI